MKLTPAERGKIRSIKNHLKAVEYKSASADYIHSLLLIIERLTSEEDAPPERRQRTTWKQFWSQDWP